MKFTAIKSKFSYPWILLTEAAGKWNLHNAPRLGAALSYYTVFSLAPLLVLAVGIAGLVFGKEAVTGELSVQLQSLIGADGAKAIQGLVASAAWKPTSNVIATVIGALTLILGGTAVFTELRAVLNLIWNVPPKTNTGIAAMLKGQLLSFAMIGGIGFLLLVSLIISTVLAAANKYFSGIFPMPGFLAGIFYSIFSFGLISVLFAAIFKVLPDEKILWRDVGLGALMTALLFTVGKLLIGLYLGRTSIACKISTDGSHPISTM